MHYLLTYPKLHRQNHAGLCVSDLFIAGRARTLMATVKVANVYQARTMCQPPLLVMEISCAIGEKLSRNSHLGCLKIKPLAGHLGLGAAQLVKRLTLDFSSGHDLTVQETEYRIRLSVDSTEPLWNSLSSSLPAPPLLVLSLSLFINK